MARRIVVGVVHAHHHGDVRILGRGADHHLPRALVQVKGCLRPFGEVPRALDHHIYVEIAPGQHLHIRGRKDLDSPALENQDVVGMGDLSRPHAVDAVVLQKMGKGGGVGEVIDGHHFEIGPFLDGGPQEQPPDAPKPVDGDLGTHLNLLPTSLRLRLSS